jgi:hypothetical protein
MCLGQELTRKAAQVSGNYRHSKNNQSVRELRNVSIAGAYRI